MLAYGVCVGSWDRFGRNVVPHSQGRPVLGLAGQTSIAEAYNAILNAYRYRNLDALILQHDDLEITDPDAEAKFLDAVADPDVALVGVAGGSAKGGLAWWNLQPVGHQVTDSMNIDFGPRTGEVELIEGSIMVLSPWAIRYLHFDTALSGFHGYDEIAAAARHMGKRVMVADVDTYHHTTVGFESQASEQEWLRGDQHFRRKWGIR